MLTRYPTKGCLMKSADLLSPRTKDFLPETGLARTLFCSTSPWRAVHRSSGIDDRCTGRPDADQTCGSSKTPHRIRGTGIVVQSISSRALVVRARMAVDHVPPLIPPEGRQATGANPLDHRCRRDVESPGDVRLRAIPVEKCLYLRGHGCGVYRSKLGVDRGGNCRD